MLGTSSGGRAGFPGCDSKQMWERLVVAAYTRTPAGPRRLVLRLATPAFRVGVLAVVFRPDGRLLLVDQPYNPGWALPGGDLRRGEGPDAGLARELREEIGLQVTAPQLRLASLRTNDRWVTFVTRLDVEESVAAALSPRSAEISRIAWHAPSALPALHPDTVAPLALVGVR